MDANERRARASADASEWWLQLQSGEMSRAEREQFVVWLRESAIHVAEMLRIAQLHNALEQFERWTHISTEGSAEETVVDFPSFPSSPSLVIPAEAGIQRPGSEGRGRHDPSFRRRTESSQKHWLRGALAASVIATAIAITAWLPSFFGQTIETERGERREVALSDGSVLQVDPQTRLRVKLEERTRKIVLERGRALFRVAKDPSRPFTVQADDTIVRAVGTAFAVERESQGVTVTVTEGKVAILTPPVAFEQKPDLEIPPPVLLANEQLTVKHSGERQTVRKVDTRRELAWTEGRLVFDNATVATALAEFNRYNRVQLRVADDALAVRRVSGVFDASDPESFIAFIQTVTHVRIVRSNGEDIVIALGE